MCYVPNSDPRLIGLLVKHGAKCNETDDLGKTALDRAIEWGLYRTCDALLENGANPNHTFNSDLPGTPLTSAVWRRKDRIAEILLAHGANPNQCNSSRHYPLHYAVAQSDGKIVRLLLSAGADVGVRDSKGVTPIMLAREIGDLETLALLKGRQ